MHTLLTMLPSLRILVIWLICLMPGSDPRSAFATEWHLHLLHHIKLWLGLMLCVHVVCFWTYTHGVNMSVPLLESICIPWRSMLCATGP